jgi:hypothetical protein
MRSLLALTLTISTAASTRADDAVRDLVDKAIQAHGGAATIDKYPAGRAKAKGTIILQGAEYPFLLERVYQMPGKLRITSEMEIQRIKRPVTCVVNGNAVAELAGGLAQEMPKSQVTELRTAAYVLNLTRLTPLLKDKKLELSSAGEREIDKRPVVGISVSSDGHKEVRLYFDKETQLLAAVERSDFDDRGRTVEHLEVYSKYRQAAGLKYPTKTLIKQGGKRYVESETTEFTPLTKIDSREFQIGP